MGNLNEDPIYIELNNWFVGEDYPIDGMLRTGLLKGYFHNDNWCKENKLCVLIYNVDMSVNYCITATKTWVEEQCPEVLSDRSYNYEITHCSSGGSEEVKVKSRKYSDFLRFPEEDGDLPEGTWDVRFLEYSEENFGVHYTDAD